jgi:hypothetical protein
LLLTDVAASAPQRGKRKEAKGMFWNLRWIITLVIVIAVMAVAIYGRPD